MTDDQLKYVLEAALLAGEGAMGVEQLHGLFAVDGEEAPSREQIREALDALQADYAGRGVELVEVASGFRFQVRKDFAPWVNRLWEDRPPKYSRALLETLAIIAYRQPITRAEIEDIRGVSVSSSILKTLIEREWIRVAGHRDVPGRPAVYATTRQFLDYFNLKSLSDLPTLAELRDLDEINPDLFAAAPAQGGEDEQPADTSADTAGHTAPEDAVPAAEDSGPPEADGAEAQQAAGQEGPADDAAADASVHDAPADELAAPGAGEDAETTEDESLDVEPNSTH